MSATTRREILGAALAGATWAAAQTQGGGVKRYVRFRQGAGASYGLLEGDTVRPIRGNLLGDQKLTGAKLKLADVKLLYPCDPPKILAVGLNYKSHIGNRKPPANPEIFYKPNTCQHHPGDAIVIPADSKNTHYEGEMVVMIRTGGRNLTREQAKDAIFGVTCGNDVSERDWQGGPDKDLQWWRAKGADTFGPYGPVLVAGLDYGNLLLQTRLNGKVVQKQSTSDLLFDCPAIISYISKYVTLTPGDIIFTGTPGSTQKMSPGDIVEVELEGVGILKNPLVAGAAS